MGNLGIPPSSCKIPPLRSFQTGWPTLSFLVFCTCRLKDAKDHQCLDYFHAQLWTAYQLRSACVRTHLVVPPSDNPDIENSTIILAILERAQILGDPEPLFRLVAHWPFLIGPTIRALDAAGQLDWIRLIRERVIRLLRAIPKRNVHRDYGPRGPPIMTPGIGKEPNAKTIPLLESLISMNYKKLFPSKYLNSADVEGQDNVAVTIRKVSSEEIQSSDGDTEEKPVLCLEDTKKKLILNRTNADTIAELHGTDIDKWTGKQIVLYVEKNVHAFGKKWDVIRIKSTSVESAAAESTLNESDLPF